MNSRRIFFAMIGLLVLIIGLAIGGTWFGNKVFQKQSKQLIELKLEEQLIREQETALLQANKDINKYADLEKVAKTIVPQDKDQAEAIREINNLAQASGIGIAGISFPSSSLGQTAPKPTTEDGASVPAVPGSSAPTQVKPVEGIVGVYSLELNIVPTNNPITYDQFITFLSKLENNRRTAQITKISIQPQVGSNRLTFEVTLNIYIKP